MNYIAYRYKLSKLNCKRSNFTRSISKDITEARENGNKERLEKLHTLLNTYNINHEKSRHKLLTRYFSLRY
jgi:hypothetical protein